MKVKFEYDQDPRYGWASVDLEGLSYCTVIMHDESGSRAFTYKNGVFTEVCNCAAWSESECACGLYNLEV